MTRQIHRVTTDWGARGAPTQIIISARRRWPAIRSPTSIGASMPPASSSATARLLAISSCGHAGIINMLKWAQEVSGVERTYALVGGFHLAPAPDDHLRQVMAELKNSTSTT